MIDLKLFQLTAERITYQIQTASKSRYVNYAGLIPVKEDESIYPNPINAKIFAMLGGDAVRYSILEIDDQCQPIIMTVPFQGCDAHISNFIMAENLEEFLGLGYHNGWFFLEQLAYQPEWTFDYFKIEMTSPELLEDGFDLVKRLRDALGYSFVPLRKERIQELDELYFDKLEFGDPL